MSSAVNNDQEEVSKKLSSTTSRRRPSGKKVFLNIFFVILSVFAFRWLVFEMFVIPSGSMYPHLFVRDYLVATKLDFGLRLPFSQKWAFGPYTPKRGRVVIFKSMDDSKFLIKRVIGLPGDLVKTKGDFVTSINGNESVIKDFSNNEEEALAVDMRMDKESFTAIKERIFDIKKANTVLTSESFVFKNATEKEFNVPPGHLLVMGDNRHKSYDGRMFGYLPLENLVGRARRIVFSCDKYNPGTSSCDLKTVRYDRIGAKIGN